MQPSISDLERRIDELERAVRYYPPVFPPGYMPPPTAPYPWPPLPNAPVWPWPNGVIYCAVAH
jgi:hypothetical protein